MERTFLQRIVTNGSAGQLSFAGRSRGALVVLSLAIALVVGAGAGFASDGGMFDVSEDALFGAGEDDLFGAGEDDLFGGNDLLIESEPEGLGRSLADELLMSDGVQFGGTYRIGLNATRGGLRGDLSGEDAKVRTAVEFGSALYADARPSKDFRLFAKARLDGRAPGDDLGRFKLRPKLTEAFADFHSNNKVFFRAGKQMIHWGVGYFFSPADIINIGRIDPEDPEADREGPVALKANMPVKSDNYYVHIVADDVDGRIRFALAPKAEWVVGGTEFGLGGYYRDDRAPRGMVTVSGSLGKMAYFGEGVVSYGSDKRFVQADPDALLGVRAVRKDDELFAHGTVGVRRSWSDSDGLYNITGAAQYYFNGEGYSAGELERLWDDYPGGVAALLAGGQLSWSDLYEETGRHYAAVSVNWMGAFDSRFSPGLFWLGNLQDNSGMVTASVGIRTWDKVSLSVGATRMYGDEGREYTPFGDITSIFVNVGYSGSF